MPPSKMRTQSEVRWVCNTLSLHYRDRLLGNKRYPLDEFLYIILSLRTHERGYTTAYKQFKSRFPSWIDAYRATTSAIASAIRPGGLALQKARRIRNALRLIKARLGEVSLRKLKDLPPNDVERFLLNLPGIGLKSARCIMMYSLSCDVLPVDTHVARICKRLGWGKNEKNMALHRRLDKIIPRRLRYAFHVCCVQHGRVICRSQYPRCYACCLSSICPKIGACTQGTQTSPT